MLIEILFIFSIVIITCFVIYNLIVNRIRDLEISSYKRKCMEKYLPIPYSNLDTFTGGYDHNTSKYLLSLALNVELSNCSKNLGALPSLNGYVAKELIGTVLGAKRMLGYIFTSAKSIIIVFTGTVFSDEWSEDAEISQVSLQSLGGYRDGDKAHKGFYNMYSSIRSQLLDILKTRESQNVYITGHSLGGALSTLAGYDLANLQPIVYTFSSPRVFNISGADRYTNIVPYTYRIFNTEDIFTSLPLPVGFNIEYQHVGNGGISFTLNLGSMSENHTDAYINVILNE